MEKGWRSVEFSLQYCSLGVAFKVPLGGNYYAACTLKYSGTQITTSFRNVSEVRLFSFAEHSFQVIPPPGCLFLADYTTNEISRGKNNSIANDTYNQENVLLLKLPPETLLVCPKKKKKSPNNQCANFFSKNIFSYVSGGQLLLLSRVCRFFFVLSCDLLLWEKILIRECLPIQFNEKILVSERQQRQLQKGDLDHQIKGNSMLQKLGKKKKGKGDE